MRTRVVVLAALVPLLALPATVTRAADPPGSVEIAVVVVEAPDGTDGLQAVDTATGLRTPYGTVDPGATVMSIGASRDGSRTVTREDSQLFERLVVRDISGARVWSRTVATDAFVDVASLSPNGTRIAFTDGNSTPYVRVVALDGSSDRVFGMDGFDLDPVFLTEDLVLASQERTRGLLHTIRLDGGPAFAVLGLQNTPTVTYRDFQLDPTGTRATFVRKEGASQVVQTSTVTLTGDSVVFGPATTLPRRGAWTRDGQRFAFSDGDLRTAPVAGGAGTLIGAPTPLLTEGAVAVGVREGTAPTTRGPGTVTLDGTVARFPFYGPYPADPTLSRLRVTRTSSSGSVLTRDVLLPVPGQEVVESGLVLGQAYAFAFQVLDRSGNEGPATSLNLVATAPPALGFTDPTSSSSTGLRFPVRLAPDGNPGDTRYTVNYRSAYSAFLRWATLTTEPTIVFGAPASGSVASTTSLANQAWMFRALAYDRFGNATKVVAPTRRAVVPRDQTSLTYTGRSLVTVVRTGSWGGTSAFLRAAGDSASLVASTDRVQVVGERCPTCGAFDVFVNGVRQARVDTRAAVRLTRQVLWSKGFLTGPAPRVQVRAVGTPGRPTVVIDAVAAGPYRPPPGASLDIRQELTRGQQLVSTSGSHRLVLQVDGNLVLSTRAGTPLFQTATRSGALLVLQATGDLVLLDRSGRVVFHTGTGGQDRATALILQNDGNLVVYKVNDGRPLWSSRAGRTS